MFSPKWFYSKGNLRYNRLFPGDNKQEIEKNHQRKEYFLKTEETYSYRERGKGGKGGKGERAPRSVALDLEKTMDYRKLISEWQAWQNEDPEDWKEFRNSLRDRKAREEAPYEFDCNLWETYKDHHLCDVCMIESCIPRRYKMGRRQEEEYYAFVGEPDQFWQPGPASECKTYDSSEYTQAELQRLAQGLPLQMISKSVARRLEIQKTK